MKILMISPQPFFTPRGTPFSVYYRSASLSALGHQIDLVTYPIGRDVAIPNVKIYRSVSVPFIKTVGIGPSFKKLVLDFFLFWKCFGLLLLKRYDFVHAHEEAVFFCLFYKLFFWRLPILYDMHSSLPQQLRNFNYSKNSFLIGLFSAMEIWSIRMSKAVITICPELASLVNDLDLKTPHEMIENSICDPVNFSDSGDAFSEDFIDWDRFKGKKVILYTGTFEYYQGIPLLLESIREVVQSNENVLAILIGGAPHQVIQMKKMAKKLGVDGHVVFTGNIHPNTVKIFIKKADVLVSPRQKGNNTPLKIYEYLASGKPIIATDHHTHTQVLTDDQAVLAKPLPGSYAQAILKVLSDPGAYVKKGENAQALYKKSYGAEVYMKRLKKVCDVFGPGSTIPASLLTREDAIHEDKGFQVL